MIQEKCTCPNYCKNKHHLISCPHFSYPIYGQTPQCSDFEDVALHRQHIEYDQYKNINTMSEQSEKILKSLQVSCDGKEPQKYFLECCDNGVIGKPHDCKKEILANYSQLKEPEMLDEVVQIQKLLKNSDKILKDAGYEVFDSVEVFNFLIKKIVSSIESAARYFITIEERKRLCDEIIDEIKTKKIDMFGWKSCLMHSDDKFINNSYNSGLETAISIIESTKNKI